MTTSAPALTITKVMFSLVILICYFVNSTWGFVADRSADDIVKQFNNVSSRHPITVVITLPITCDLDMEPFYKELDRRLRTLDPSVGLFQFFYQEDFSRFDCSAYVGLHWRTERISYYKGELKVKPIISWVRTHIQNGKGVVLNINDEDNYLLDKLDQLAVYATFDRSCEQKLSRALKMFLGVARRIAKLKPNLFIFKYKSRFLFQKSKTLQCDALPVYVYSGLNNLGKKAFTENEIADVLQNWILGKMSGASGDVGIASSSFIPSEKISADEEEEGFKNEVIDMSKDEDFEKILSRNSADTVVAFHYDGCQTGSNFDDIMNDVLQEVRSQKLSVKLGKVNAGKNVFLLYKHAFGSFPILQSYKKGKIFSKLTGSKMKNANSSKEITNWITEKLKAKHPDDRSKYMKEPVARGNDYFILEANTLERALRENQLLIVAFRPELGYNDVFDTIEKLSANLKTEGYSDLKMASKIDGFLDHFAEDKKMKYPLFVVYHHGRGIGHVVNERKYMSLYYSLLEILRKTNDTNILSKPKAYSLKHRSSRVEESQNHLIKGRTKGDVITVKSTAHFQKEMKNQPTLLLASYPTACCPFSEFLKSLLRHVQEIPVLKKIRFAELSDAFQLDDNGSQPYIDFTLFHDGNKVGNFQFVHTKSNQDLQIQGIIQWLKNTLHRTKKTF